MRYESLSAKLPFITKLNVFCEKLEMSLTDTQLPMFCRLLELCIALYYGTLELPALPVTTVTEEVIDRNVEHVEGMFWKYLIITFSLDEITGGHFGKEMILLELCKSH